MMMKKRWTTISTYSANKELFYGKTGKKPVLNITRIRLDGQGRARREAARSRKSECKINLGPR